MSCMAETEQRWRDLILMCDSLPCLCATIEWLCWNLPSILIVKFSNHLQQLILMPGRSTLLSNYPVVRSSDPALVRDRLFSVYGANSFDVGRADSAFAINADHLQIGGLGLSYGEYTGNVSVGFGEVSFVRQCFSIEGAARYAGRTQSGEIRAGDHGLRSCMRSRSSSITNPVIASLCCESSSTPCCAI